MKTTKFSRIISLVLVFVMLSGMLVFDTGAKAVYDENGESLFTYVIEGEGDSATVTILKCSDKATGKVVIPAKIDGVPVTKIDKDAFEGCSSITSLVIPEGVEVIGGETPEVTITKEDYLDLFVKRGLIYHLNFVGVEAGTVIEGSESYEDATAVASDRFYTAPSYWNSYIYDAVKDANGESVDYINGGVATINGGWKFVTPYEYNFWFDEGGTLVHTKGDKTTFDNFITEDKLDGKELADTSSDLIIDVKTQTVYDVIYTAPSTADGFFITPGVDGKVVNSSYMGDGYMSLSDGERINFVNENSELIQNADGYTVEVAARKPQTAQPDAFYIRYNGVTTVPFLASSYIRLDVLGIDSKCLTTDINTTGIISYTFTVDKDSENGGAELGFYVNGRTDFVASNTDSTPVSSTSTVDSLKEDFSYAMQDPGVETYAIRVYSRVLTKAEVLQNNFADIATVAKLDISAFLKLTETEKQKVYEAFEGVQADEDSEKLQLMLDAVVSGKSVVSYYDLFVTDGLLYHTSFNSATTENGAVSNNSAYAPFLVYRDERIADVNPWYGGAGSTFGDGYLAFTPSNLQDYFYQGDALKALLTAAKGVTVELTATLGSSGLNFWVGFGPTLKMSSSGAGVSFSAPSDRIGDSRMLASTGNNYQSFNMTESFNAANINTLAFAMDLTDIANKNYTLDVYGNGKNYTSQSLVSGKAEFAGNGELTRYGGSINIYALRVYERELTADELLQNHFADVALINQLDISDFVEATAEKKAEVYKAFETVSATEANEGDLQELLDNTLSDIVTYSHYDLYVTDGLLYHTNFKSATTANGTVTGSGSYASFLVYKDSRIGNPWYGGAGSTFGDGYLNFAPTDLSDNFYFNNDLKALLKAADGVTVEFTATFGDSYNIWFGIGPTLKFSPSTATAVGIGAPSVGESMLASGYETIRMNDSSFNTANINTYAFAMDLTDLANMSYTLDAYGNGKSYSATQTLTSTATEFAGSGSLVRYGGSMKLYALRVYEKELTADELLQNHFADVALINDLDISGFMEATAEKKAEVYKAFETVSATEENDGDLQKLLDETLEYTVYDLFVQDGLLYHTNFKSATTANGTVSGKGAYESFLVYMDERIGNPWYGVAGSTFGEGYLNYTPSGSVDYVYNGDALKALLKAADGVTFELTASFGSGFNIWFGVGPILKFSSAGTGGVGISKAQSSDTMLADSGHNYSGISMTETLSAANINTYSLAFDYTNLTQNSFTLDAYGNGKNYSSQSLVSKVTEFAGSGSVINYGGSMNIYALRVYERELTADEVLQNHFADIININSLEFDINAFLNDFSEDERIAIYRAFETVSATGSAEELQVKLDKALLGLDPNKEYTYYDLFVQDGLLYHTNFKSATTANGTVSGKGAYESFLVYMDERIGNPWYGVAGSTFGDGYLNFNPSGLVDYVYNGDALKAQLKAADGVTFELTASFGSGFNIWFGVGPILKFSSAGTGGVGISKAQSSDTMLADSGHNYTTISMTETLNSANINTYSLAFDYTNLTQNSFTLDAYGNGKNYSSQSLVSKVTEFAGNGSAIKYGGSMNIYALRVYEKELTADEVLQNNFADIVTVNALDLDVVKFIILSEDEKLSVYKAFEGLPASDDKATLQTALKTALKATSYYADAGMFADCDALTSITLLATSAPSLPANAFSGSSVEEIVVPASAVSAYEAADGWSDLVGDIRPATAEDILTFEGYQARLEKTPGLRSTYSINRTAIELLEAEGKKVTVGAIMASALGERDSHEDLVVPTVDGEYDRTAYGEEYSYISGGVAYQEIYRTEDKDNGKDGVVAALTSVTDAEYEFAFTTLYKESSQTKENFQDKALLYRGFVIVTDGDEETIFYADMTSPIFDEDENGDAITMYQLSKHINEGGYDFSNNEMIVLVVNKVDGAETPSEE